MQAKIASGRIALAAILAAGIGASAAGLASSPAGAQGGVKVGELNSYSRFAAILHPSCGDAGVRHTGHIDGLHDDGHLGYGPRRSCCTPSGAWRDKEVQVAGGFATPLRHGVFWGCSIAKLALLDEISRVAVICAINRQATPKAA